MLKSPDLTDQHYGPTTDVCECLIPQPDYNSFQWICNEVAMPDGRPFDADAFPWTQGICEAADDPDVSMIVLQFAARLGKTAIGQSLHVCTLAHKPGPSAFGTSTEQLAKQVIKKKLLPILRETSATRPHVPPDHELLATRLDLRLMTIYVAWSGSSTTLADIDPAFLHAGEADKWSKDKSDEGDPLDLFLERGAERQDRLVIVESTPSITGGSRINHLLLNGWNCRYQVPCVHCGHYQQLAVNVTGDPRDGGLWWDRLDNGDHPKPDAAMKTARYICAGCHGEIHDEHRRPMIRKGVWVPEGMHVSNEGTLLGHKINDGPVASFQLSRIYAPTFSFGDFARNWVASRGDLKKEQNHANSWAGETWTPRQSYATWDMIARRLCGKLKIGEIAEDVVFLTAGVDVQERHLVWKLVGWRGNQSGDVIAYGIAQTWEELFEQYLVPIRKDVAGLDVPLRMTLVDSRHRTDEVLHQCRIRSRKLCWIWPLEGVRASMVSGKGFLRQSLVDDKQIAKRDVKMIKSNTPFWQGWLDNCLIRRVPGDPNSVRYPANSIDDQDLFEQVINESPNEKGTHEPINEHIPVDFRDCLRYARLAAEVYTNGAWNRLIPRSPSVPVDVKQPTIQEPVKPIPPKQPQHPEQPRARWHNRRKINFRR